jgi:type IV pilus assembly protein PilA
VTATVRSISSSVDASVVTLVPLSKANTPAVFTANQAQSLFGWRCGDSATDGTNVPAKFLPGSCRG